MYDHIYIHIPFCRSKCIYCDFYSTPSQARVEQVVEGLIAEFDARHHEMQTPPTTIYLGGGTPSILPLPLLSRLLAHIRPTATDYAEITLEVNPDDVDADKVAAWRRMGINRVSIGVQSLSDPILRTIRRRHTAAEAIEAIRTIHDGGITNISADLIYGLPGLDNDRWQSDLRALLELPISHLSAYCLTYHEGTPLYTMWQRGKVTPADDDTVAAQYDILCKTAAAAGFEHYEISNFALPGRRSRHNSSYWDSRHRWLGIGPSAHSFDGSTRRIDLPDISAWLNVLPLPFEVEEETGLDRLNDYIVAALRTADGLCLGSIPEPYRNRLLARAARFISNGPLRLETGETGEAGETYLRIPASEWLISDYYIRELLLDEADFAD